MANQQTRAVTSHVWAGEQTQDAPPEPMRLRFGTGEVTHHGWALEALVRHRPYGELESLSR